ncbi:uncharacterized protein V6R79_011199 [Siganus canaliculatus]
MFSFLRMVSVVLMMKTLTAFLSAAQDKTLADVCRRRAVCAEQHNRTLNFIEHLHFSAVTSFLLKRCEVVDFRKLKLTPLVWKLRNPRRRSSFSVCSRLLSFSQINIYLTPL